jgi:hypothetical protein
MYAEKTVFYKNNKEYIMKKTVLIMVILLTAITTAFAQTAADFIVELNADGNGVIIKKYTGKVVTVKVPETIEGFPVREIGNRAFYGTNDLYIISVILPYGITKIAESSFANQPRLASVVIPNSVTEIEMTAFWNCTALKSVTIPGSVTSFGRNIFAQSGIESFILGEGITIIPEGMFSRCNLTSVVIPEGITEIGDNAFNLNSSLTSVTLPSTIQKIGDYAFYSCNSLITVSIPDSVEIITFYYSTFNNCQRINLVSQAAIKRRGYTGSF